jgi:hypothetical protein
VRAVLAVAEQVLREYGQDGRDFIGAGFLEDIPDGGEAMPIRAIRRTVAAPRDALVSLAAPRVSPLYRAEGSITWL